MKIFVLMGIFTYLNKIKEKYFNINLKKKKLKINVGLLTELSTWILKSQKLSLCRNISGSNF